jgi:hypothetical protein
MNTTEAPPRTDFDEEGWVQIPHADWKSDAAHARKPLLALLQPANACRLEAMATLRTEATEVIGMVHPQDPDQVKQCLWPPLSKYALQLFDKTAEQKLNGKPGAIRSRAYGRWLTSKCLPAVVDDICAPIFGQFFITVRHVAEFVGEGQAPGGSFVWRALWETLAREFSTTSPTKTLRARLEGLLGGPEPSLGGRINQKRAGFEHPAQANTQEKAAKH